MDKEQRELLDLAGRVGYLDPNRTSILKSESSSTLGSAGKTFTAAVAPRTGAAASHLHRNFVISSSQTNLRKITSSDFSERTSSLRMRATPIQDHLQPQSRNQTNLLTGSRAVKQIQSQTHLHDKIDMTAKLRESSKNDEITSYLNKRLNIAPMMPGGNHRRTNQVKFTENSSKILS